MLSNFLIGLREGLEASLVIAILISYLVRSDRKHLIPKIWLGVGFAALISLAFGALLTFGPAPLDFKTQENIGGFLSIIAVGFVTWMVFWMAGAAKGLAGELRDQIDNATLGQKSLVFVAFLAVAREGLETAMFLWAATRAVGDGGSGALTGALLGLASAIAMGYAFYKGALKINLTKFFKWTGAALIVVAAGVLAYGIHDLQESGLLPGLNNLAFDVSSKFEGKTGEALAAIFKGTVNFTPKTTVLQAIGWLAYLVPVMTLFWLRINKRKPAATSEKITR